MPHGLKKIAIISKCLQLGDYILLHNFISDLRYRLPDADIHWVIINEHKTSPQEMRVIFQPFNIIFENYNIPPKKITSHLFKPRQNFDAVINLDPTVLSNILLKYFIYKSTVFIPVRDNKIFEYFIKKFKYHNNFVHTHIKENYHLALNQLIDAPRQTTSPQIDLSLYRPIATTILPPSKQYIGFVPNPFIRPNCWTLDNFIALAKEASSHGFQPCFFLDIKMPSSVRQKILEAIPNVFFPEEHVPEELQHPLMIAALMENISCAYTNDIEIAHVLGLAQKPLTVLFEEGANPEYCKPSYHPCLTSYWSIEYPRKKNKPDIPLNTVMETMKYQLMVLKNNT